jgi:hypothetical protein
LVICGFNYSANAAEADSPGASHDNPIPSPSAFAVPASNGYTIGVVAEPAGRRGRPDEIQVSIADDSGYVVYSAPTRLDGENIRADFGTLGTIDMSWHPNGRVGKVPIKCRGYHSTLYVAEGAYRGSLRIDGENGFTTAKVTQAKGRTGWFRFAHPCGFSTSEGYPGPGLLLDAYIRGPQTPGGSYRFLSVVQNRLHGQVSFFAGMGEQKGRISVAFRAYTWARAKALSFDGHFDKTAITPPDPFSGTGTFERVARHRPGKWLGDLTVDFPGREDVPLAGHEFTATFRSGFRETEAGRAARVFLP